MISPANYWTNIRQWVQKIPINALNNAYQSALNIQEIETKYFQGNMISHQQDGGQSVYEYYKSALDRELININVNLTQLRVSNFLNLGTNSDKIDDSQQQQNSTEILEKLGFIENVIGKYRKQQEATLLEPNIISKSRINESSASVNSQEKNNQDSADFFQNIEISLGQNFPLKLRGNRFTPEYEQEVVQSLRQLREKRKIAWRILILLITAPLLMQILSKNFVYTPILDYWKVDNVNLQKVTINQEFTEEALTEYRQYRDYLEIKQLFIPEQYTESEKNKELKKKVEELVLKAGYKTQEGLANILADITGLITFLVIVYLRKRQCRIAVSFLSENFLGLNIVTQVFIFILLTDMFVGFHSAEGWDVILEQVFIHLGLTENPAFNGVFIATIPVIMDSTFKLLIFNYFSRKSPASVAILEKMNQ